MFRLLATAASVATIGLAALPLTQAAAHGGPAGVVSSFDFATPPAWDFHDVFTSQPAVAVKQDFGHRPTAYAGGAPGEVGGTFSRSLRGYQPGTLIGAHYAAVLPTTRTLENTLVASGKIAVSDVQGDSGVLLGWFRNTSRNWRMNNFVGIRLDGANDGTAAVWIEYGTQSYRHRGTPYIRQGGDALVLEPGHNYEWELRYEPRADGSGRLTGAVQGTGQAMVLDVPAELRADGAQLNRFGLHALQVEAAGKLNAYVDDLAVDGRSWSFSTPPADWVGNGTQDGYVDPAVRGANDFGYRTTATAGGAPGEIGGRIFRGGRHWAADATQSMDLDRELTASGRLAMTEGTSDSEVLLGWFDVDATMGTASLPRGFVGAWIEGDSPIGWRFGPAWATVGAQDHLPSGLAVQRVMPDGVSRLWHIHYTPMPDGTGVVRTEIDGEAREVVIPKAARDEARSGSGRTTINRFGLRTREDGSHSMTLYIDDVSFTSH